MTTDVRTPVVDTVNRAVIDDNLVAELREASVAVLGRTILVSNRDVFSPFGFEESLRDIVNLYRQVEQRPADLLLIREPSDIEEAIRTGRTGVYVYFQSPEPILNQLWRLQLFHQLGLRVLQMTYNQRSLLGDGCSEPSDAGLSELGQTVIEECNNLGIALDASHCGPKTTLDTIDQSAQPVLLTHTGAKAIHDHPRCKSDEVLKACAERGGVIGIAGMASLIAKTNPSLDVFFQHVDYLADLVGPDHIGLGLDFITGHETDNFALLGYKPEMYQEQFTTGVANVVEGLESIRDIVNIKQGLVDRGFPRNDVENILGGNFIRVFRKLWK